MVNEKMTFMNFNLQKSIWERIILSKKNNRIGSAYLFLGPNGSGKEATALKFSAYLNCTDGKLHPCGVCGSCKKSLAFQHENSHLIIPTPSGKKLSEDGIKNILLNEKKLKANNPFYKITLPKAKTIPISDIRNLKKELFLKSIDKGRKIILIFDAHMLCTGDASSANALLKILEEPPENTTFILVSDYKGQLLPTILSRCQIINFPPIKNEIIISYLISNGVDGVLAEFAANMCEGNMHFAQKICDNGIESITQLIEKLTNVITIYNEKNWRNFVQEYSRLAQKDLNEYEFHLFLIQCWLKLARKKRILENENSSIRQLNENVENFNSKFPIVKFDKINFMIEDIINAPKKNLFMPIQLTNFLINVEKKLIL